MYSPSTFTWGAELELGDVSRDVAIPPHLGTWDYSETDVVNQNPPYRGLACDPLGIDPPVGGEINTKPTKTWQEQVSKIAEIVEFFKGLGQTPTTSCVSNNHIHVHVPGLKNDIAALKRLMLYVNNNQKITVEKCHKFMPHADMLEMIQAWRGLSTFDLDYTEKTYLKTDSGMLVPPGIINKIIQATTFDDIIKCLPADRIFRYAINICSLQHIDTIEFRCFRNSIVPIEIVSSFKFVERFLDAALNNGPSVLDILASDTFYFTNLDYNHELYTSWQRSKYPRFVRGNKVRTKLEVV